MSKEHWQEILKEMQAAIEVPAHPFRFPVFATIGLDNVPRLRTVVLRKFNPDPFRLTFYSDSRSKKITHINENQKVSALCYHPELLLQIRFEGMASVELNPEILNDYKSNLPEPIRIEYRSAHIPGSVITGPEQLEYINNGDYFTAVHIHPFKIEYLRLNRPKHIRIRFSKNETGWNGEYLAP
ncbi:MAG: hypothetical protein RLZZ241_1039 [Bacteroidota bacterium]